MVIYAVCPLKMKDNSGLWKSANTWFHGCLKEFKICLINRQGGRKNDIQGMVIVVFYSR